MCRELHGAREYWQMLWRSISIPGDSAIETGVESVGRKQIHQRSTLDYRL